MKKGSGNKMGILDRLKRGKRTSKEEYRRNHILRIPYSRPYPSRMEGISNKISG